MTRFKNVSISRPDFSYENGTYPDQKSSSGNKKKIHAKKIQNLFKEEVALFKLLESHNQKEENILYPGIDNLTNEQEKGQMIKLMQVNK